MRKLFPILSLLFIASPASASETADIPLDKYTVYAGLVLGFYLFVSWFLFGRDPEKETVVPQLKGLPDLTPAQAGWIYSYGQAEDECLIASLLQNNISGFCEMHEEDVPSSSLLIGLMTNWGDTTNPLNMRDYSRNIQIDRLRAPISDEEALFDQEFSFPLRLEYHYSSKINRFVSDFKNLLRRETGKTYFTFNTLYLAVCCLLQTALAYGFTVYSEKYVFTLFFTLPFLISCIFTGRSFFSSVSVGKFPFKAIVPLAFAAFFLFLMLGNLITPEKDPVALFSVISGIAIAVYAHLIIRPTEEGMRVISHLDGIKMFLKDDSLTFGTDANSLEELLPYAVVIGAEKEWASKMSSLVGTYTPLWNDGLEFSTDQLKNLHMILSVIRTRPRHRRIV